jgi:hypothetical protein
MNDLADSKAVTPEDPRQEPQHSQGAKNPNASSDDLLQARPTQRISQQIEADGDTWQETLAVCEAPPQTNSKTKKKENVAAAAAAAAATGKLIIRSYFQNARSGQRVWDEPPSGASRILPATEEMRRMAELQLSELQIVTGATADSNGDTGKEKKKRGFFGFGKRKDKTAASQNNTTSNEPKGPTILRYKPGSSLLAGRKQKSKRNNPNAANAAGDSDAQLQEAIARSLAESQGIPYEAGAAGAAGAVVPPSLATATHTTYDDDELAMAKALSLSAAQESGETEDQLLSRVLQESKLEDATKRGTFQAAMSEPEENDLLGMMQDNSIVSSTPAIGYYEDDRKLPASATAKLPPPTSAAQQQALSPIPNYASIAVGTSPISPPLSPMFDPYAKDAPSAASRVLVESNDMDGLYLNNNSSTEVSSSGANLKKPPPSSSLQKMDPNNTTTASSRLNFGKRSSRSSKKIQDRAGLV